MALQTARLQDCASDWLDGWWDNPRPVVAFGFLGPLKGRHLTR